MCIRDRFIAGIDPRMANVFTITTLLISVPITEMIFVYIATLYGGSIRFTTPMLWALSFIAEFLIEMCIRDRSRECRRAARQTDISADPRRCVCGSHTRRRAL